MTDSMYRPTDLRELHDRDEEVAEAASMSAGEHEATGELIQGELAGKTIYVPPVKKWRASALHKLREGDYQGWAEATLLDDDMDIFEEVDPTIDELEGFFNSISGAMGGNAGNSRASRRSQRSTKRR